MAIVKMGIICEGDGGFVFCVETVLSVNVDMEGTIADVAGMAIGGDRATGCYDYF